MRRAFWGLAAVTLLWGTHQDGLSAGSKHRKSFGCAGCGAPMATCAYPRTCGYPGCAAPTCYAPGSYGPGYGEMPVYGFDDAGVLNDGSLYQDAYVGQLEPGSYGPMTPLPTPIPAMPAAEDIVW